LIILGFVTLITVLVVGLLFTTQLERTASNLAKSKVQAEVLADYTADLAMEKIREAITEGSQFGTSSYTTWASEPGRIHVFTVAQGTGEFTRRAFDLFSAMPGADDPNTADLNNVDLNKPSLSGVHPITGSRAGSMKIGWLNLLADPGLPASKDNQLVARVAYWVDDESAKVNINVADGSQRTATPATMAATKKYSYGFGTPSELSIAVLPGMDQTKAEAIAASAWEREFNSVNELSAVGANSPGISSGAVNNIAFDITHYNSSPDLNFMGEPRISLIYRPTAATGSTDGTARQNINVGPYVETQQNGGPGVPKGKVLDFVYPQPSQLPKPSYLPLVSDFLFLHTFSPGSGMRFSQTTSSAPTTTNNDYYVGKVITSYLDGTNLAGKPFTWPKFTGSNAQGFSGKYTTKQLDTLTLQMLDMVGKISFCDQSRPFTYPAFMLNGWLSNQPASGVGRGFLLNEVLIDATATEGDPFGYGAKIGDSEYSYPALSLRLTIETTFPEGFRGVPQSKPYDGAVEQLENYTGGYNTPGSVLNFYDAPIVFVSTSVPPPSPAPPAVIVEASQTGTKWMDQMLTVLDQDGNPAGIDLAGNARSMGVTGSPPVPILSVDSDQGKAALYHPYCIMPNGQYSGSALAVSVGDTSATRPFLRVQKANVEAAERAPGVYSAFNNYYPNYTYFGKPGSTSLRMVGGLNYWQRFGASSGYILQNFTPFDSPIIAMAQGAASSPPPLLSSTEKARVLETVLPIDFSLFVPGTGRYLLRTVDPLVSRFPGDWEQIPNPGSSDITMPILTGSGSTTAYYKKGGAASLDPFFPPATAVTKRATNFDGDNVGFRPSGGGDPLSIWMPNQDNRIPKQARFPSVGALFSIRTGLFPDPAVDLLPYRRQHGVPFRGLNMSPSDQASQQTDGGTSYPDWAMLDLFTVPFLPQKPYMDGQAEQPYRKLTAGGATIGRININNPSIPYPFAEGAPNNDPPERNSLQSLFFGLNPSNTYDGAGNPVYDTIDAAESKALADAIAAYQKTNGPFFMAGQIANVPEVAAFLYKGVKNASSISRNDLVRDTVGAITTRSNVFSIWVVAQTVTKNRVNSSYGAFEDRDTVTSTVRRRYLVERYIETGKDFVPGNAPSPFVTNTPNAYAYGNTASNPRWNGDAVNADYHPTLTYPLPYRWRILAVETYPF